MNEAEWLATTDDATKICMKLDFLTGRASERKFNLFRFACCRQIWHLLVDDQFRQVVETAERVLEGRSTKEELESALLTAHDRLAAARQARAGRPHQSLDCAEIRAAILAVDAAQADYEYFSFPSTASYACGIVQEAISAACWAAATDACWPSGASSPSRLWPDVYSKMQQAEATSHGVLLLDVFGNPFRPVTIEPSWLGWNDATLVKLAAAIYEDRAFDRLHVLADALEYAGCHEASILDHCRQPGPHVRGCWVVDLLSEKCR